ncbi:MAG: TetR/AcrR family transcriptional regulator [Anaerolineae bacterium]|jgi:AcrR family transcriptional regulator|nr:TetR/AcrR family transcriptional regulator [Anaerolineae bacterium]MBT7189685.1 TetR/AcrR family transcriptional regulator [Anaerolineae bacterium]MBT7988255.1 TetR/AcrR family transcriptional regulator [Anaerolineae bacterium]
MDTSTKSSKEDRRITRTKNYLRNAILDLTVERGEFNSVQINEIADKADVARSTFYLHYADKEKLLYDALDGEFQRFLDAIREHHQQDFAPINLLNILTYVNEHPRYFQVVLNTVGTTKAFDQTRKTFEELLVGWIDFSVFEASVPHELITYHLSGTIINTIKWWLETENDYSPEEMKNYIFDLLFSGILQIVGLNTKAEMDEIFAQQIKEKIQ